MAKREVLSLLILNLVIVLSLSNVALGYRTGGLRAFYFVQQVTKHVFFFNFVPC